MSPWHSGDFFVAKIFIKYLSDTIGAKEYILSHFNSPRLSLDLPNIIYDPEPLKNFDYENYRILEKDGDLYINTWIGRTWGYLLPGTGVTIEGLYNRFKDDGLKLDSDIYKYIPQIDPSYYDIQYIDNRVDNYSKKILICNGAAWSSQSINFDFSPIVYKLANNYKDRLFVLTEKTTLPWIENIVYTDDLFGRPMNDLNEIGYFSTFCNLIIGRNSGPHTFSQNSLNWFESNKTLLSLTTYKENSSIIFTDTLPMRKVWCNYTEPNRIYNKIIEEMERLY